MIRAIILFLVATFAIPIVGCGGSDGGSSSSSDKSIFSSWAQNSSTFVLDMSSGRFGSFSITYMITGGAICDCSISVGGTQASGNAVISGCTYRNGTGGGSDPGCASLNASYTYTESGGTLSVCNGGTCNTYH